MSQEIILVWNDANGKHTETCKLVSDNSDMFVAGHEFPGAFDMLADAGYVSFEDDFGIFYLLPEQIVSITSVINN